MIIIDIIDTFIIVMVIIISTIIINQSIFQNDVHERKKQKQNDYFDRQAQGILGHAGAICWGLEPSVGRTMELKSFSKNFMTIDVILLRNKRCIFISIALKKGTD